MGRLKDSRGSKRDKTRGAKVVYELQQQSKQGKVKILSRYWQSIQNRRDRHRETCGNCQTGDFGAVTIPETYRAPDTVN